MNNYKIRVNNEAESWEAQELFFELGCKHKWDGAVVKESWNKARFIYAEDKILWSGNCSDDFAECNFQELTLPQLRDLVVLHRNDVNDATHSCDGMSGAAINLSGSWYGYNYNEKKWQAWDELEDDEYKISDLKPIQKPQPEQGLISGADALRALADGEEIQWISKDFKKWNNLDEWNANLKTFLNEKYIAESEFKFRLKPRTVKLEIEVPEPFEPKEGERYWRISFGNYFGYDDFIMDSTRGSAIELMFGAWRTEAEIKIVVEQLRKLKELSQ